MLWKITRASLATRRIPASLVVLAIALSVLLVVGIERLRHQVRDNFATTVSGIDLIVSARGGPLNILLYSVFRISDPTAGISWRSVEYLAEHPQVDWWIPLSLGDSHRGFPVVATNQSYLDHYRVGRDQSLVLHSGHWFGDELDVVLGASVAAALGYAIGDEIVLAHGNSGAALTSHDAHPFRVAGVLAATGTPVDQSLHISLAAMEKIHSGAAFIGRRVAPPREAGELTPSSVTAVLVGLKSRAAVLSMQRELSRYRAEPLSAILPGVELHRLWRLTGYAENALRITSWAVLMVSLLVLFATVLASLESRRHELAVLRAVGARRSSVYRMIAGEGLLLTLLGCVAGLVLLFALQWLLADHALTNWAVRLPTHFVAWRELLFIGAILFAGTISGLIPAERAFRQSLADGLTPRY